MRNKFEAKGIYEGNTGIIAPGPRAQVEDYVQ